MTNEIVRQRLTEKFGDQLIDWDEPYGMLTFSSPKDLNLKILQFLFDDAELRFQFMADLCVVHYPDRKGEELAVVYHLHNLIDNIRIRFKVYTDINKPDVFSATALFQAANWLEREGYDFYGVNFIGHPNLIRIQNVEEMEYFPQRKEYPLEDQSRIDKDDEMFGRGGSFASGDKRSENGTISEEDKIESNI